MKKTYKRYIAKGYVEWNAAIKLEAVVFHIPFTNGGFNGFSFTDAEFITDNPVTQNVIETSDYFKERRIQIDKKYNRVEGAEAAAPMAAKAMAAPASTEPHVNEKGKTEVPVSCLEDAKEYLSNNYGISKVHLRSKDAVIKKGEENNIVFVGNLD